MFYCDAWDVNGNILLLGEHISPRLVLTSIAILGGIALVIQEEPPARNAQ